MNRKILFRGKRVDNGEWVCGFLTCMNYIDVFTQKVCYDGQEELNYCTVEHCQVDKNTVGQFTGLCDKNGNKIFEGDIIHIKCGYGLSAFVGNGIVFIDEKCLQFRVKSVNPSSFDSEKGNVYDECDFTVIDSYEVIGNIYDNPELLEVEQ